MDYSHFVSIFLYHAFNAIRLSKFRYLSHPKLVLTNEQYKTMHCNLSIFRHPL
jgi:hypothetical protein